MPDTSPRTHTPRSHALLFIITVIVCIAGYAHSLRFPFGVDQGIFSTSAHQLLKGKELYTEIWDFKPPGIHLTYALAFLVGGEKVLAIRATDFVSYLISLLLLWKIAHRFSRVVGAAFACLSFMLLYSLGGFWHTAQPESFSIPFLLGSCYILFLSKHRVYHSLLLGFFIGVILLFKISSILLLPFFVLGIILYAEKNVRRVPQLLLRFFFFLVGISVVVGLVILLCSSMDEWWRINTGFVQQYIHVSFIDGFRSIPAELLRSREFWISGSALLLLTVLAVYRRFHIAAGTELLLLGGWLSLLIVAMQGKAFPYHFYLFLPFVVLLSAILFSDTITEFSMKRITWIIFPLIMLAHVRVITSRGQLIFPDVVQASDGDYWKRMSPSTKLLQLEDVLTVSKLINQNTSVRQSIFLWGMQSEIYFLSRRYPTTRFLYNLPLLSVFHRSDYQAELLEALQRYLPELIIVESGDVNPEITGERRDSKSFLHDFSELQSLIDTKYELAKTVGVFEIYHLMAE